MVNHPAVAYIDPVLSIHLFIADFIRRYVIIKEGGSENTSWTCNLNMCVNVCVSIRALKKRGSIRKETRQEEE